MSTGLPLVSVIIPCYNADRWIADAIDSALRQTYEPLQIVVIDDGSTDDSLAIIRSFEPRITWRTGPNRGGNAARNLGLSVSTGAYIQWLDADDTLVPDKIEHQVAHLETHRECDAVYGDWRHVFVRDDGAPWRTQEMTAGEQPDMLESLLRGWWTIVSAYLVRRQVALAGGGWDPAVRAAQDFDYWVGLALAGCRFCYQPEVTGMYRHHGAPSVSASRARWLDGCARVAAKARLRLTAEQRLDDRYKRALAVLHLNLARNYFDLDRAAYERHLAEALELDPNVRRGTPRWYRLASATLGDRGAEYLARVKRRLARQSTARFS